MQITLASDIFTLYKVSKVGDLWSFLHPPPPLVRSSPLHRCAVYNKYVKAVNAAAPPGRAPDVVSPAELFTLLSSTFPGTFRQKISVGSSMKFVVKNMDWLRSPALPTSTST